MFKGLSLDQLPSAIEALLFVSDDPISADTIAEMLEVEKREVAIVLKSLSETYVKDNRGIQLREVAGGWRLSTHPAYAELIETYVLSWDTRKITNAQLETLAIIAYTQPVTRNGISSIRGVNSDSTLQSLIEKGLVREAGIADAPGAPLLYATTRAFLEKFGLRSTADLPDISQFAPDEATRDFISERLSATRVEDIRFESPEPGADMDEVLFVYGDALANDPAAARLAENGTSEASPATDVADAAKEMLGSLLAGALGTVEKIDFDQLTFESGDD